MTIEQYLEKYNNYIRGLIYKRADDDYRDDAYQEVVMAIINYKDKLDSLDTDAARCAYICQIAKHTALPQKRANKKLKTYGDFTASDDDDATDPEECFLEDERLRPDNQPDLAKRAWAEEIIDTNEQIKKIEKLCRRIRYNLVGKIHDNAFKVVNREHYREINKKWRKNNKEKCREYRRQKLQDPEYRQKRTEYDRKYRETHREQFRTYYRLYNQRKKEKINEQLRNS